MSGVVGSCAAHDVGYTCLGVAMRLSRSILIASLATTVAVPLLTAPTVAATGTTSVSAAWTQSGYNAQHTRNNPFETTLTRSDVGHLVRAFITMTKTGPDPIVVGGVAYLSNSGSGFVQAIDARQGAVKWTANACRQGQATTAAAFSVGKLWVGLNDPSIAAVESTSGATFACPSPGDLFPTPLSTYRGVVYAGGGSGELVAISAMTGQVLWSVRPHSPLLYPALQTPAVSTDGSTLYVGSSNGYVYRVNAGSGAIIWAHYVDSCGESAVTVSGSKLYVSGCNLYALSAATGGTLWHSTHLGPTITAPAVAGGLVFAGGQGNYAGLGAFDANSGALVWHVNEFIQDPPSVANGVVYVNAEFALDAFNSSTGARLASVSTLPNGFSYVGSPTVLDGRVYLCSSDELNGTTWLAAFRP
jgi:eukaryotic-like serine/threonine-protein kinase